VSEGKYLDRWSVIIRTRPLPSMSFPTDYSVKSVEFDAM
jgi:hypothetical protein